MTEEGEAAVMGPKPSAEFDITHTLSEYMDLHLMYPLLQFLEEREIYSPETLMQAKLELLKPTNMVDFAIDIHKELNQTEEVPAEMLTQRETVLGQLEKLQKEAEPMLNLLDPVNAAELQQLIDQKAFTPAELEARHSITEGNIEALFQFAKFQFECGNYEGSLMYLTHYGNLMAASPEHAFKALWGKFASEILMMDWNAALEDLNKLREAIDARTTVSPLEQLQQRTWLIHWSLFVFFNHPDGRDGIVDFYFQQRYLEAIQTNCPWILRYLTTAVITNKRRRNVLKDLIKVIEQEKYTYKDPITEFLECLYVNFDFEGAQEKLRQCENVLVSDFFLVFCHEEFMENARLFIFETYCRIHQKIDIGMLASKLAMQQEEAERWIVDLIRGARLDAKIDSNNNHVIMGAQFPTVYEQVIEKTKDLSTRSYVLASNLERQLRSSS